MSLLRVDFIVEVVDAAPAVDVKLFSFLPSPRYGGIVGVDHLRLGPVSPIRGPSVSCGVGSIVPSDVWQAARSGRAGHLVDGTTSGAGRTINWAARSPHPTLRATEICLGQVVERSVGERRAGYFQEGAQVSIRHERVPRQRHALQCW